MLKKPIVSVIIPVYNAHNFLSRCLSSLVKQSLSNIEVIVVDDGSSDDSVKIVKEYMKNDNRIRLIEQKNSGPAYARHEGVLKAKADYIMFVDADDYVTSDFCEDAYTRINIDQTDLCFFRYTFSTKISREKETVKNYVLNNEEALSLLYDVSFGDFMWNKIYRKQLLLSINTKTKFFMEDLSIMYKIIDQAKGISVYNKALYYYNTKNISAMRNKSLTHRKKFSEEDFPARFERNRFIAGKYSSLVEKDTRSMLPSAFWYCLFHVDASEAPFFSDAYQVLSKAPISYSSTLRERISMISAKIGKPYFLFFCKLAYLLLEVKNRRK